MYITRRLSHLKQSPEAVAAPPDGPNSGYLVIQDTESEQTMCFGLCKKELHQLPFPQNKELQAYYVLTTGTTTYVQVDSFFLIPCLDQPLSSDRYYAIVPHGKHIGEAFTSSTEGDKISCCFCRCIKDVKSRTLDPHNVYQQFQMVPYKACCTGGAGSFYADSVAPDGFPPNFLRQKGWSIYALDAENSKLDTAEGVNSKLRSEFFNLPLSSNESLVVGKWYCPFVFVKEETLRDQVKKSLYYEVTLEQRWKKIFSCSRTSDSNRISIDTSIEKEEAFIERMKARWNESDGVIWFGAEKKVGLSVEVVRRMKWEEERFGYKSGEEGQVKVERVEEYNGDGEWSEFGSYVLVERFNLKRMDGSLVMCYDFKHLDKIKNKWE